MIFESFFPWQGWMYYNKEHLGDRTSRMEKAVQLLLKAIETDPNSGAAWYLIGRLVWLLLVSPLSRPSDRVR